MILGLNGKMGSGKDTAYQRLAKLSPIPVVQVSYAAKLKESVAALFGISLAEIERWKNNPAVKVEIKGYNPQGPARKIQGTFRAFLQRYGTEAHRDVFGQDFWLDAALPLDGFYDDALYVVTDMRFVNELERVKALGGSTACVLGPHDGFSSGHASELPLPCDYWINNTVRDDGFKNLDGKLQELLAELGLVGAAS